MRAGYFVNQIQQTGRMKSVVSRVLLAGFGVFMALLCAEVALRLAARVQKAPAFQHDRSAVFFDIQPGRDHPWSASSDNPLRIAVVGDSFAKGVGVQLDDRYAARLERLLNCNDGVRPAEVRVFDLAGTSTFQQFPLLKQALDWKADIVILGLCLNDAEDWARPQRVKEWRRETMPPPPPKWLAPVLRHSRVLTWIHMKCGQVSARRGYHHYYRRLYKPDYKGFRRLRESLGMFKEQCDAAGVRLVVMIFPLLADDFSPGRYPFENIHITIRGLLKEKQTDCLDLLGSFRGMMPVRMQAIPDIDPHPSEIAHRIAAEALLNFLLDHGVVDAAYRPQARVSEKDLPMRWNRTAQRMQNPSAEDETK